MRIINEKRLQKAVNESVSKVLKEYANSPFPYDGGGSQNEKVRAAQFNAMCRLSGKGHKNDSSFMAAIKHDGGYNSKARRLSGSHTITRMLFGIQRGEEEEAIAFGKMLQNREDLWDKVYHALYDEAYQHQNEYYKWNK